MGKRLIIKGANFSMNAIENAGPVPTRNNLLENLTFQRKTVGSTGGGAIFEDSTTRIATNFMLNGITQVDVKIADGYKFALSFTNSSDVWVSPQPTPWRDADQTLNANGATKIWLAIAKEDNSTIELSDRDKCKIYDHNDGQ